jgi:hypothetical protein
VNQVGNHAAFHKKFILIFIYVVIKKLLTPTHQKIYPKPGTHTVKNFNKLHRINRVGVDVANIDINSGHTDTK